MERLAFSFCDESKPKKPLHTFMHSLHIPSLCRACAVPILQAFRLNSAAHRNQLIPVSPKANRLGQQQITHWHAIRCLSHWPAATHASEVSLKAKMSICPPRWCESSPRKTSSLLNAASAAEALPAQAGSCLSATLVSCLSGARDQHLNVPSGSS